MLERLSIRWRLALISSLLTLAILSAFAVVIGEVTTRRIRSDFNSQLAATTDKLREELHLSFQEVGFNQWIVTRVDPKLDVFAVPDKAAIRLVSPSGSVLAQTRGAPDFGYPVTDTLTVGDFRVAARSLVLNDVGGFPAGYIWIQYARPLSQLQATISRVRGFLFFGVLAGAALALAAGLVLARRAMSPIAALTRTTREIATTGDPNRRVPVPKTDDEVAELARTLDAMLQALEASRAETTAALARQREFVADASHELRTPLTSVYANLEILAETLDGDERDAASSALRSTQRMKRLVADLLLLARADAHRDVPHAPTDLARVVVDAAAELGPVAEEHAIEVDADVPAVVLGARDDLFRLVLNLLQNAVEHTPRGTSIRAAVAPEGDDVVLTVTDDGPGIDAEIRERLFERFIRGSGDRGGSTGLGLAIVKAVAEAHGGEVAVGDAHDALINRGTRFTVRMPRLAQPASTPEAAARS